MDEDKMLFIVFECFKKFKPATDKYIYAYVGTINEE
jgi:hypothetical protein